MNDQRWNDPGARASATEVNMQSGRDCDEYIRRDPATTRRFSDALVQFDPDDRLDVLEDAHEFLRAGMPIVLFGSVMEQAVFWADRASRVEHKAYALACVLRMSPEVRRRFTAYIRELPDE